MNVHDFFLLDDTLRSELSLPASKKLEYTLDDNNILNVESNDFVKQFLLVKISGNTKHETLSGNSSVLQPELIIKNKHRESYGAFQNILSKNYALASENNIDDIKLILNTLAKIQTFNIKNQSNNRQEQTGFSIREIINNGNFKSIETSTIKEISEKLQEQFDKLVKSSYLVKSLWSARRNVYVNEEKTHAKILEITHAEHLIPPAYDALLYIFSLSNEKFRQHHFHILIKHYFDALIDNLHKVDVEKAKSINREYIQTQLITLLPVTKFVLVHKLDKSEEIISNLEKYLKYPTFHQEDVYLTVHNKLNSDEYELLDYSLTPIKGRNGHLGEYFNFNIVIRYENQVQDFTLFQKSVGKDTQFDEVIEKGAGIKEDFFYNILYPLYKNYTNLIDDIAPKCYFSNVSSLVLDNLVVSGYKSFPPNTTLNQKGIETILSKIAKYHASSIITEEIITRNSGKKFRFDDHYSDVLSELMLSEEGIFKDWVHSDFVALQHVFQKLLPHFKAKLKVTEDEFVRGLKKMCYAPLSIIKKSNTIRNVINHGDAYVGNMLFKFDENNRIVDGKLIDFQTLRYIPPAFEVQFFILLHSNHQIRKQHFQEFLDFYYQSLSECLRRYKLDPEKLYSRNDYESDLIHTREASIGITYQFAGTIFLNSQLREEVMFSPEKFDYYILKNRDKLTELGWEEDFYRSEITNIFEVLFDFINGDF
ncbi:hypothetical protein ABEB36_004619 [Hypothenemus hampei]|uniref:CHK kinase-like domain-containing protein n=1 Tax=Hypothenemus hampei TaxID=57062 RepID=A0ABD1F3W6_HYPHA